MTAHSPVGKNPAKYQVVPIGPEPGDFAWNDLWHDDPTGADHEQFGPGLAKALYNYLHGVDLDEPLSFWFDFRVPRPTVPRHLIQQAVQEAPKPDFAKQNLRLFWLGNAPELRVESSKKAPQAVLTFYEQAEDFEIKTTLSHRPVAARPLRPAHHRLRYESAVEGCSPQLSCDGRRFIRSLPELARVATITGERLTPVLDFCCPCGRLIAARVASRLGRLRTLERDEATAIYRCLRP